ncbi:MAG: type I-E CRISPR-associated endonuclease Cas1e [Candidatus Binatus sp.]|uniref:type I-E CRISPR-associated endonuclease Cas1e n=1 Tax=Candidatus Binatus sp. TaxID=2811406 RepID=UPI0027202CBB|nr:type I-E CRISPR-associated endonuclease Cas1e [Candidatus Binatus sp.]MDO8434690.1 type I-E CRISPR-associated endonuclease Cas1e [Candidatus Binatus sp.]
MLKGRLGLETARIPQADRHGLLWLGRGNLTVEDGTLRFTSAGDIDLAPGEYLIPFQMVSCVLLGPGTTISHDALRLLARHGTGLIITGEGGVRLYASMPFGPDDSALARKQATLWSDSGQRMRLVRRMYAWRLGEVVPDTDLDSLRGLEGARMRETYKLLARQFGIDWAGRHYDRSNPEHDDLPNQAINHAATAVEAAAMVAVAVVGALPQLGFIHEDSGISLCLDIADLYRHSITLPVAFGAVREFRRDPRGAKTIESMTRKLAGRTFRKEKLISKMIDHIKELFADDSSGDP